MNPVALQGLGMYHCWQYCKVGQLFLRSCSNEGAHIGKEPTCQDGQNPADGGLATSPVRQLFHMGVPANSLYPKRRPLQLIRLRMLQLKYCEQDAASVAAAQVSAPPSSATREGLRNSQAANRN